MSDPLIDLYKKSLLSPHPWRTSRAPFLLPDSVLKIMSQEIQQFGRPLDWPPDDEGGAKTQAKAKGVRPGEGLTVLRRLLAQLPADAFPPAAAAPIPPAPASGMEDLRLAMRASRKPFTERWQPARAEVDFLWRLYEQMVADEYAQLKNVRKPHDWWPALQEFEQRGGATLYADLRPVYFRSKVTRPHKLIMMMQPGGVRVAGVPVQQGIHPEFVKLLRKADGFIKRSVASQFGSAPVKYIGCFRPDPLGVGDARHVSNHMLGAAVDIDATRDKVARNPHLQKDQIKAVDRVLAFHAKTTIGHGPALVASGSWLADFPAAGTPEDRAQHLYTEMLNVSLDVRAFLDAWLDRWIVFTNVPQSTLASPAQATRDEAFQVVTELVRTFGGMKRSARAPLEDAPGVKALRNVQKNGFVSIPADIFIAMLKAGLRSGLEYGAAKDTMHFEIKSPSALIAASGFP
ncbi:hypothetical protein WMF28_14935 [Sorangium sp. So ce590]|uniref:hypothetical protein n=1 Tax=Sorangium sp. So ce590 TaxID=3133317 RepID=UPI003F5F5E63